MFYISLRTQLKLVDFDSESDHGSSKSVNTTASDSKTDSNSDLNPDSNHDSATYLGTDSNL